MSDNDLRMVLVRAMQRGTWNEMGYTVAQQAIRRPVTFRANRGGEVSEKTLDGLALIGSGNEHPGDLSIEPLARDIGNIAIKIDKTTELLWLPVAAHRDPLVGMWTIECVPLVEWFRASQRADEEILRLAGIDPETGRWADVRPCPACGGRGTVGMAGSAEMGSIPISCPKCLGTGQHQGMAHE